MAWFRLLVVVVGLTGSLAGAAKPGTKAECEAREKDVVSACLNSCRAPPAGAQKNGHKPRTCADKCGDIGEAVKKNCQKGGKVPQHAHHD